MQKRWYQSSHSSHCTQCTCFPVGLLHLGLLAEQSSSESAAASSALLASSFFFFLIFFLSLSSAEPCSVICIRFFIFSFFLSSLAATSSASSWSNSGYFLSLLPGVACRILQMWATSSRLTSSRSPSIIRSSSCTIVLAVKVSTSPGSPPNLFLGLLGPSPSLSEVSSSCSSPSALSPLLMLSLARAALSSGVASTVLALSCQAMARSVKHCNASPSGSLTVSFCKDTSRLRMVSSLGLLLLRQAGQRNLISLSELGLSLLLCGPVLGRGTEPGWNC